MLPFQEMIRDKIRKNRHVIINKFAGAGMTEIIPRIALELAFNDSPDFAQIAIITGTRMEFTEQIIAQRILPILYNQHKDKVLLFKKARINLSNGYYIQGYPTENVEALHGQRDIQFLFVDEAAFFHPNKQEAIRIAVERNISKSDPYIVWNSTPHGPTGAFYNIYMDALNLKNDYDAITINYTEGLETGLLLKSDVDKIREYNYRMFQQEFDNKFIAPLGSVMPEPVIRNEEMWDFT